MGSEERKKLLKQLETLITTFVETRDKITELLNEFAEDAREAHDNMPETLQDSERGERLSEIADAAENLASDVESLEVEIDLSEIE